MSSQRQEELTHLLGQVLQLPAIMDLQPDARMRLIHYDWLEAGEVTQRTVAQLSQQLRRFLDDQVWLENRRIMDILRGIESKALALRGNSPTGDGMSLPEMASHLDLPMERPLYTPALKLRFIVNPTRAVSEQLYPAGTLPDWSIDPKTHDSTGVRPIAVRHTDRYLCRCF